MASKFSCVSLSPAAAAAVPISLAQVESEIFAEEEVLLCDICQDYISENDAVKGLCETCTEHVDEGINEYTEDFALASVHGKDAVRLFVLRQRADNCREVIADAADWYDGILELHEASLEENFLNKLAAECLARLPTSFAPWWRDAWTHEKWRQVYHERKAAGWPLASADVPIVQRLAATAVAQQNKMHEMKKAHAEVLAKSKEDMEAVEARHQRQLKEARATEARLKREMAEKDKRYVEALDPLLGVRDKVRAECDKKCHDAERKGYAAGYAFADQKWNPVYKAVCEELEAVRKEGAKWYASYTRLLNERDEAILTEVDLRRELDAMAQGSEKLEAEAEELRKQIDDEVAAATKIFTEMRADLERLRAQNNALKEKNEGLLELVGPTQKLMASNPELFGGEARGGAPAPGEALPSGTSSPRPPAIIRLPQVKEEDTERVEKFLKGLVRPFFRDGAVVEKPSPLPGIEEAEGLCCAWPIAEVEDQPTVCGTAGCIDCPAASVAGAKPEPPAAEPVAGAQPEPVAKPKPNYNHPNWPSPTTKRFAKHLAKHSGKTDPKTIKTHQDALEFIAKRANISVEQLLKWTINHYQSFSEPWTLVKGGTQHFHMGTAPATWWC